MWIPALSRAALLAIASAAAILLLARGAALAGSSSPAVALQGPSGPILPGSTFEVTVVGADLPALGAYEVVVSFDELHVEFVSGADAGFLGSTGRNVFCVNPIVTGGEARFGCASTGSGPGPDGDATLATMYFKALQPGRTEIGLKDAGLAGEFGDDAGPAALRGASITIEGAGKPNPTATPDVTKPEPTAEQTAQFVPPVDTPTTGAPAATRTAIPTATNTRAPNASTPAGNQATSTPAFGVIAGTDDEPAARSSDVQGTGRAPAGIALPETGSGGGNTTHPSWLLLIAPAALLLLAVPFLRRGA